MNNAILAPQLVALVPVLALSAAFVSGVTGMAGGMLMMGVLVLLLPVPEAMVLHGITQLASNGCRLGFHFRFVSWPSVRCHIAGAVIVVAVLSVVRFVPSKAVVLCVLGVLPFLAAIIPKNLNLDFAKPSHAFICGLSSSLSSMTVGVAGGTFDLFFLRGSLGRFAVMGTKSATQIFIQIAKISYFYLLSNSAHQDASLYCLVPAIVISTFTGIWLGKLVLSRMSECKFRSVGNCILFTTGGILIAKGLLLFT